MGLITVVVCAFLYSAAECAPKDTPSYGTLAANDFSNNLATINQNLYNGVTALATPISKLAIDTAPDLAHLYAIFNGVNVPPALADLAKKLYRNAAVGGGKLAGNAAVLGSSVAESSMNVGSHGLQALNDVLEAAAKAGINLTGNLGDYAASGTSLGADILAADLKMLGDAMLVGSVGVNVLSQGISNVTDAIGRRMVAAIALAEKAAAQLLDSEFKVLENGALKFADETQQRFYDGLVAYFQILTHVQNIIHLVASSIAGISLAASTSGSNLGLSVAPSSASATN